MNCVGRSIQALKSQNSSPNSVLSRFVLAPEDVQLLRSRAMKRTRKMLEDREPSGQDIREACELIQSRWTDSERRRRAGLPKVEYWRPPTINQQQLGTEASIELEE